MVNSVDVRLQGLAIVLDELERVRREIRSTVLPMTHAPLQHYSHIVDEQVESLRRLDLVKELDSYTEPVLNRTSADLVKC